VNHASIEKVLRLHLGPKAPKLGPPLIVAADAYDAVCAEVRARLGAMEEVDFNPDAQRPKKGEAWVLSIHVRDASAHGSWRDHVPLMLWRGPAGELRLAADSWGGQSRGYPLHDYDVLVPIVQAIHTAGEAAALRAKKRDKLLNLKELALRASIDAFAREDGITSKSLPVEGRGRPRSGFEEGGQAQRGERGALGAPGPRVGKQPREPGPRTQRRRWGGRLAVGG
jgi:hypothetical protein